MSAAGYRGRKKPLASQAAARARAAKERSLAKKKLNAHPLGKGHARRIVVVPDDMAGRDLAKVTGGLKRLGLGSRSDGFYEVQRVSEQTPLDAASTVRRLELWVDVMPPELAEYQPRYPLRRRDLLGQIIQATKARTVLCTEVDWLGTGEDQGFEWDLIRVWLFDRIDVDDWNLRVCPRCERPATASSPEGIWWCYRHMTRAWQPVEFGDGATWQETRLMEVGD